MKKQTVRRLQTAAALGVLATGGVAVQQLKRHARQGWGRATTYGKLFDPARLETFVGRVVRIARFVPLRGMSEGIELLVDANGTRVPVHLGPREFVDFDNCGIDLGANIEVTGSSVELEGERALIATAIRNGDQTLEFRKPNGAPVWRPLKQG